MKSISTVVALLLLSRSTFAQERPLPIIDMHLHASSLDDFGGGVPVCTNDQKIMESTAPHTLHRLCEGR